MNTLVYKVGTNIIIVLRINGCIHCCIVLSCPAKSEPHVSFPDPNILKYLDPPDSVFKFCCQIATTVIFNGIASTNIIEAITDSSW